jgi:hypothetical protein
MSIPAMQSSDPSSAPLSSWMHKWTPEEDQRLLAAIRQFGDKNWKQIADHVGTRDHGMFLSIIIITCSFPILHYQQFIIS